MIPDFNLIATSERGYESQLCSEIWMMLRAVGDKKPLVDKSPVRGLVVAKTSYDPAEAVKKMRIKLRRRPQSFMYALRILPIEKVVITDLDEVSGLTEKMASKIGEHESFRVTVEKRRTRLRSREIIETVAAGINRKVDLGRPDWIVLVEVIGMYTGISVIRPHEMLNIQKEKASLPADGDKSPFLDEQSG